MSDDSAWYDLLINRTTDHHDMALPGQFSQLEDDLMPARDMAIFRHCKHVIRTHGTYSLWGALFSEGSSMYATVSHTVFLDDKIAEQMGLTDWTPVILNQWMTNPITAKPSLRSKRKRGASGGLTKEDQDKHKEAVSAKWKRLEALRLQSLAK